MGPIILMTARTDTCKNLQLYAGKLQIFIDNTDRTAYIQESRCKKFCCLSS